MSNPGNSDVSDDDNFGLPDTDFKPLEDIQSSNTSAESNFSEDSGSFTDRGGYSSDGMSSNNGSGKIKTIILAIFVPLILLVGGYFIYQYWSDLKLQEQKEQQAEALRLEKEKEERERKEREQQVREVPIIETPGIIQPGKIEILESPTGRYYVVLHSSLDGDLLMDQARKFSEQGISALVIPPSGNFKFTRLSIQSEETFSLAQQRANELKEKYGQDLWVLRY